VHLILNFEWLPEELLEAVNIASCEEMSSDVIDSLKGGMRKA
jgi:hypothetical protein